MRDGNTLRKQTTLVRVPLRAYNFFFFLNIYYTHGHSNYAVTHPLIYCMFQKVTFAPLAGLEI